MKVLTWTAAIAVLLVLIYLLGPAAEVPDIHSNPIQSAAIETKDLDRFIAHQENNIADLKKGNNARIVWADSLVKKKTAYSINDPAIAALIMYSPNIDLYDSKSALLTQHWGLQLARLVVGDKYYTFEASPEAQQYWNTKYRIEALIVLKSLLNTTMNEKTFQQIHVPVFMGYYYKDETHQDDVVSIPRMMEMFEQLSTSKDLKRKVNFPNAGYHVIGSSYWNPDTKPVEDSTAKFLEEIMQLQPVN